MSTIADQIQKQARVRTKPIGSSDVGQIAVPPIVHEVLASPGQSLYPTARGFMEPRFGYHLFGWIDAYYDPKEARKNPRGGPNAPWQKHVVARRDAAGRGDLLGLPDPEHLRAWREKGFISQTDFDCQTRTPLKVWQEDADQILPKSGSDSQFKLSLPPATFQTHMAPTMLLVVK